MHQIHIHIKFVTLVNPCPNKNQISNPSSSTNTATCHQIIDLRCAIRTHSHTPFFNFPIFLFYFITSISFHYISFFHISHFFNLPSPFLLIFTQIQLLSLRFVVLFFSNTDMESSFEAWEEVQRHGQDIADRLTQGFTELIHTHITPPQFVWPNPPKSKLFDLEFSTQSFGKKDFGLPVDDYGVSAIFDIGNRIGQAGMDFGASLNGMVQQFFRSLPVPFKQEEDGGKRRERRGLVGVGLNEDLGLGLLSERLKNHGFSESVSGSVEEDIGGFNLGSAGHLGRRQV